MGIVSQPNGWTNSGKWELRDKSLSEICKKILGNVLKFYRVRNGGSRQCYVDRAVYEEPSWHWGSLRISGRTWLGPFSWVLTIFISVKIHFPTRHISSYNCFHQHKLQHLHLSHPDLSGKILFSLFVMLCRLRQPRLDVLPWPRSYVVPTLKEPEFHTVNLC